MNVEASSEAVEAVLNSLTITDSKGRSQTLYFGADASKPYLLRCTPYLRHRLMERLMHDLRHQMVDQWYRPMRSKVSKAVQFPVTIQSDAYPLTITWKVNSGTASYELTDDLGDKVFAPKMMSGEGTFRISNSVLSKFTVRLIGDGQLPKEFALSQNYPNPFNPTTTIMYNLPKDSHVSLKLFNILGQEVVSLVNEDQKAGYRSVEWNANSFASGVYLYRIQAGGFVASKKLLLLK